MKTGLSIGYDLEKLYCIRRVLNRRAIAEIPMHKGQLPLMEYIHIHPGCTQVEIAHTLLISPSSVAQSVKRLERMGYIEKRTEKQNQRCNCLFLTGRGREAATLCRKKFDEIDESIFSGLDEQALRELEAHIKTLLQNAARLADVDAQSLDKFTFMRMNHMLNAEGKDKTHHD
ncbi:MarR family winged helix-turn-helix transcriptional regulator [Christensenellaceae bacterium OttesenSCG-928-M15]|nr:MarR family winged helix-turn-helix transcriptional regulator [Christensenellaceae bacterium OttesenSCG-928-M15]